MLPTAWRQARSEADAMPRSGKLPRLRDPIEASGLSPIEKESPGPLSPARRAAPAHSDCANRLASAATLSSLAPEGRWPAERRTVPRRGSGQKNHLSLSSRIRKALNHQVSTGRSQDSGDPAPRTSLGEMPSLARWI